MEQGKGRGGDTGMEEEIRARERGMHFHPRLSLSALDAPGWVLLVDQQFLTHAETRTKRLVTK